ncbi:hypothetical protein BPAE_0013g00580 [Botrytis paeoniae]|uniref:Galactose-1-phosphate uridylyltransferase n=1 Tax=Botrytis paeoniae TaxID=278948 RepID=A0A4Z1FY07_9HELO|nr:hypothetical protein BPAE_0013g00580 [Botrytis paeoniae]
MDVANINNVSHRRYNSLNGKWILIASPDKQKRPRQAHEEPPISEEKVVYDPKCYLCPGNARAQGGQRNPKYAETFLFRNDFSTIDSKKGEDNLEVCKEYFSRMLDSEDLFQAEPVLGRCYVLTYSAKHYMTVPDMTLQDVSNIVEVWGILYSRYLSPRNPLKLAVPKAGNPDLTSCDDKDISASADFKYFQIFDNNGAVAGCSNLHPHCQIWISSTMPEEPRVEAKKMKNYRNNHRGRHLLANYLKQELEKKEHIVWQNDTFVIVTPWWAVWPFEVLVIPKRHIRALVDLTDIEKLHFAEAILHLAQSYDKLFRYPFPYVSGLHQAPLDATEEEIENSYLHMHFCPPLLRSSIRKFFGGYELFAEPSREITPETAADMLRRAQVELLESESECSCPADPKTIFIDTEKPAEVKKYLLSFKGAVNRVFGIARCKVEKK